MRCSLLRPKWRTTGRVWVTHRRILLGVRSFRGNGPSPALTSGQPLSATAGSMGRNLLQMSSWTSDGHFIRELDIKLEERQGGVGGIDYRAMLVNRDR